MNLKLKLLAILSLTTLTLATPIAQDTNAWGTATIALPSVPTSILTVLETAIPASWYEDMLNSASRDSVISEIQAGTLPAWYNSLPASVKAWATSAGSEIVDSLFGATVTATATATATDSSTATVTVTAGGNAGNDGTHAVTATPVAPAGTTSGSKNQTAKTSSGSSASETAAKSSTPSSSTSTGGAPIATAGVAMSLAGAAGLLGLALAL